jgi:hypothetical protein
MPTNKRPAPEIPAKQFIQFCTKTPFTNGLQLLIIMNLTIIKKTEIHIKINPHTALRLSLNPTLNLKNKKTSSSKFSRITW